MPKTTMKQECHNTSEKSTVQVKELKKLKRVLKGVAIDMLEIGYYAVAAEIAKTIPGLDKAINVLSERSGNARTQR